MAQFIPKTFEQVLQRMINRVVARTDLSDITPTSVFKHILAAVAREVDDVYFQINNRLDVFDIDRASGPDLDRRALDYNPSEIERLNAVPATGNLVFSRTIPNPGPGAITIPVGTQVEVPGENPEIVATTVAAGTIGVGLTDSGNVSAVIIEAGLRGNVNPGFLTKFKGPKPTGVDTVSNPSAFVGGLDEESDDSLRSRLRAYAKSLSRSTVASLEYAATTAEITATGQRIVFARAVEDPVSLGNVTLYVDDGTGSAETTDDNYGSPETLTSGPEYPGDVAQGGEQYLYTDNWPVKDTLTITLTKTPGPVTLVRDDPGASGYTINPASGQIYLNTPLSAGDAVTIEYTWFTGIVQETQKVIDGDPTDRANYPGWRAAGVLVKVVTPTVYNVIITANITVKSGFSQTQVAEAVRAELSAYVNGLGIGSDIILSEIIERAMAVAGMFDIQVTQPVSNVLILEDTLPRVNSAATDITLN